MKRSKKIINVLLISTIFIVIASLLVYFSDIEKLNLFEPLGLFTYIGVLLGFAITIYTFSLSLVDSIKDGINKLEDQKEDQKDALMNSLIKGFNEMKENIILLFIGIVIIVVFAAFKIIINPFKLDIERYQIPEITLLSTFAFCTYSIFDLIKTLFNLSEVKLRLAQYKPKKQ